MPDRDILSQPAENLDFLAYHEDQFSRRVDVQHNTMQLDKAEFKRANIQVYGYRLVQRGDQQIEYFDPIAITEVVVDA